MAVQMDNLKGLLGTRRMDKALNAWISIMQSSKRIDESLLHCFSHIERTENDRIAKMCIWNNVWVIA